jgi:UDP-glucose 4-epimerase
VRRRRGRRGGGVVRALVTGGAGFVGSHLVDRLLADGHEVTVVDDLSSGHLANLADAEARHPARLSVHEADIRDAKLIDLIGAEEPEVIYHLAAQAGVQASVARPAFDAEVNVVGTIHVLEGARAARTRKVVFPSSGGTIYGDVAAEDLPCTEEQAQVPKSPYAASKKAALDYFRIYQDLYGIDFTVLALGNVYGARQDPHGEAGVVAIFSRRIIAGEPCVVNGDGGQTRDYTYVDDVIDAFVRATAKGGGELINIGTGIETSVNEVYTALAGAAGIDTPAVHGPQKPGELRRIAVAPGKALECLGWRPTTVLADGTARTFAWFRAHDR